jgi:hypothetical protein
VTTTSNSPVQKRITEILADETGGKSYKAHIARREARRRHEARPRGGWEK